MRLTLLALVVACVGVLTGARGEEGSGSASECLLSDGVSFDGREYTSTKEVGNLSDGDIKADRLIGTGQLASCPGEPGERVRVFRVFGVPVERAVYVAGSHGLMVRSHLD